MQTRSTLAARFLITSMHQSYVSCVSSGRLQTLVFPFANLPLEPCSPFPEQFQVSNLASTATSGGATEPQPTFPLPALVMISSSCTSLRSRTILWTHNLKFLSGTVNGGIIVFCITWAHKRLFLGTFFTSKIHRKMI